MKKENSKTRPWVFTVVGIIITIFNFVLYAVIARIINNNDLLWLDSGLSYLITTFVAYLLHSKITWKDRRPTRAGIINFFIWNLVMSIVSPLLTWAFGFLDFFYQPVFLATTNIGLPFDYPFIESTIIFIIVTIVVMILNYFFYDRLVFENHKKGKKK